MARSLDLDLHSFALFIAEVDRSFDLDAKVELHPSALFIVEVDRSLDLDAEVDRP